MPQTRWGIIIRKRDSKRQTATSSKQNVINKQTSSALVSTAATQCSYHALASAPIPLQPTPNPSLFPSLSLCHSLSLFLSHLLCNFGSLCIGSEATRRPGRAQAEEATWFKCIVKVRDTGRRHCHSYKYKDTQLHRYIHNCMYLKMMHNIGLHTYLFSLFYLDELVHIN